LNIFKKAAKTLRVYKIALLALLFAVLPAHAERMTSWTFVVSGIVPSSDNWVHIEQFTAWLGSATGYHFTPLLASSYSELSEEIRYNPHAIGWTCGLPYVEDHNQYGQRLIAVPLFKGAPVYHSLILAKKNSTAHSLRDFRGKAFGYSDPRSNSGFLAPSLALKRYVGKKPQEFFKLTMRTGLHENSIRALRTGAVDVAAVDEYVWVEYLKQHPEANQEIKEIERFGPFPFTPIVAGSQVTEETIHRLQGALSKMLTTPKGRDILQAFGLDGFVIKSDTFYNPIREMLRELGGEKYSANLQLE